MTLGESYRFLGEPEAAATQFARSRSIYTDQYGPTHPDTLQAAYKLAIAYSDLDRQIEALQLREETLALRQATLGPYHQDTLLSMICLSHSYADMGRIDEAIRLEEETLALQRAHLGPNHPDTLKTMNNLGLTYAERDRFDEALQMQLEAYERRKVTSGPNDPDTLAALGNLASAYSDKRDYARALELNLQVVQLRRARLGPNHVDTIKSIYNLGNAYGFLKDYDNALKYHQEALDLRRAKFGTTHRATIWSMWGVATQLFELQRGPEALAMSDEVFALATTLKVQPNLIGLANRRCQYFAKLHDADGCRATAELWEKLKRTDNKSLFNAACYRAVTAGVIRTTDKSPDGAKAADAEADLAMGWLQKAVEAGYKKADKIETDSDLDDLRNRTDFQAIVVSLKSSAGH
jgi:tetratricopeptide (TPR) repeat protein